MNEKTVKYHKELLRIARRFPDAQIYVFGSQAKGKSRNDSDLDIAVFGQKGNDFAMIEEAFQESNIPLTMEITCMDMMKGSVLEREVLKNGVKI